ncbi:MAG: transcription elongation factor Spt5 [Candidatus Aenigmarchaeota archaeon]|nr:transcription elongation factor Spt5 [Candidatus Aenigmarchaeota archaeon]
MIYTLRTTSGREDIVIDLLTTKIKSQGLGVNAIFHPAEIKGYIFIEGDLNSIHKSIQGLMHSKGLIEKPVKLADLQHFLQRKTSKIKIGVGDTVEIIGGPFKGEKGKITRIDKVKDEVTAELLEATIPIPVTIATEFVKVIKRVKHDEKLEDEEKEEKPKKKKFSLDDLKDQLG